MCRVNVADGLIFRRAEAALAQEAEELAHGARALPAARSLARWPSRGPCPQQAAVRPGTAPFVTLRVAVRRRVL